MMIQRWLGSLFLILACAAAFGDGDTPCTDDVLMIMREHTFRLVVERSDGTAVQQTAFRVAGRKGLFTALHGLVDAVRISADRRRLENPSSFESFLLSRHNPLVIAAIDKTADLAFLVPADGNWPVEDPERLREFGLDYGGSPTDGNPGMANRLPTSSL